MWFDSEWRTYLSLFSLSHSATSAYFQFPSSVSELISSLSGKLQKIARAILPASRNFIVAKQKKKAFLPFRLQKCDIFSSLLFIHPIHPPHSTCFIRSRLGAICVVKCKQNVVKRVKTHTRVREMRESEVDFRGAFNAMSREFACRCWCYNSHIHEWVYISLQSCESLLFCDQYFLAY